MNDSLRNPPPFTDDLSYEDWKQDVSIWESFTNLEKKKRGPALYLSLQGKARECCRGLTQNQIGGDSGVELILNKLDDVFQEDKDMRTFMAFRTFYQYKRQTGVSIKEFIIHYELLYHKLGTYSIELPQGVQSFFLLNAANISEDSERLARTTCTQMKYKNMKETILKIFADPALGDGHCEPTPAVKSEPVYKVSHSSRGGYRGAYRGGGRGSHRSSFNPKDQDGNTMRCFKCQSKHHFARFCDGSGDTDENPSGKKGKKKERVEITLLSSQRDQKMSNLVRESLGMGVLDTGCSKTVVGETWLSAFEETLSYKERQSMKSIPSETNFVFGDGVEVTSARAVKIPVTIGTKAVKVQAEVIPNEIPLLLSRQTMVRGEVVIDVKRNTVDVLGEKVKLVNTSSGHICLPLTNKLLVASNENSIVLNTSSLKTCSKEEKKKKALKLHRQFSHASKEKLKKLVQSSESFNDVEFIRMIEQVCDKCDICRKFKKPPLKPIVCMPLSQEFNGTVCMDLKEHVHNKSWIFHMIDSATKLSAAQLIHDKKETVVQAIFTSWITYFGSPRMFLSDNGGEFNNAVFREMCEQLNVQVATSAAESPFSNGTVERHNMIIGEAMNKTLIDQKCKPEIALAAAVAAKNALASHGGVSPNELVFGRNTNFPSVLTDKPPAWNTNTESDIIRANRNARHVARQKYIEAESSDKIRRALRSKVRSFSDVHYENGEKVFYRRKDTKGWKGPATVIGVDGKVVFLRHGGSLVRAHASSIMKEHNTTWAQPEENATQPTDKKKVKQK